MNKLQKLYKLWIKGEDVVTVIYKLKRCPHCDVPYEGNPKKCPYCDQPL